MKTGKLPKKIAVLMGGIGSEREVSLESGENIASLLEGQGFDVVRADITPDNLEILDDQSVDLFFLAFHGTWGEDGQIQQILEQKNLCFTGSGSLASQLSFDKIQSKKVFENSSIPTPGYVAIQSEQDIETAFELLNGRTDKFVVKPSAQGSSVGVEIRTGFEAAIRAAKVCYEKYGPTLIEDFIAGRELTVGVVNGKALPIIEICAHSGFYDYSAKYISDQTEYLFDTVSDEQIVNSIMADAVKCCESLGVRHWSRVDFMLDADGKHYALEINTLPGFTSHSLLPKAAGKAGYEPGELCLEVVKAAVM